MKNQENKPSGVVVFGATGGIASAIEWLLHPDQSWVTGQVIRVDGGLSTLKSSK